jgi:hypothetical protein
MHEQVGINIERESTPTVSEDDPERREMMWRSKAEDLVHTIRDGAKAQSAKHDKAAWKSRKLYQVFGLPTVVIPLAGSVAAQFLPEAAVGAMLLASGICAGVNTFLNYGQKAQMHFEYSSRWAEIATTISFEMAKPRADRTQADVFLERLRNRTSSLRAAEPPVVDDSH